MPKTTVLVLLLPTSPRKVRQSPTHNTHRQRDLATWARKVLHGRSFMAVQCQYWPHGSSLFLIRGVELALRGLV